MPLALFIERNYIMSNKFQNRLDLLRERMRTTKIDLVAIGPSSHMAWLAGVHPHGDERPVLLLVSAKYAGFLMPGLNADSVRQNTDLPFHVWTDADGPTRALKDLIDTCDVSSSPASIVLDETMRTDFSFHLMDALPGAKTQFTNDTVGLLRSKKDASEYEALKKSSLLNDKAITQGFDSLRVGMTESDVADIINNAYISGGARAEFISVAFGANGAFPHHHTGNAVLTNDMAVQIDAGCRIYGYPSDLTRCGWFGTPTQNYQDAFNLVERAVQAALDITKPGITAGEVDAAARAVIEDAGFGHLFLSRTGHGLGLDLHEPPYIAPGSEVVLEAGNVFSVEPGVYFLNDFGIRLEEIVILRDTGPEIFSEMPRDMIVKS